MEMLKFAITALFGFLFDLLGALGLLIISLLITGFFGSCLILVLGSVPHILGHIQIFGFAICFILWGYLLGHYHSAKRVYCLITALWLSFPIVYYMKLFLTPCLFLAISLEIYLRRKTPQSIISRLEPQQGCSWLVKIAGISIAGLFILALTIPRFVSSHPTTYLQNSAIAKEAASIISTVYSNYRLKSEPTAQTGPLALIDGMHYVSIQTNPKKEQNKRAQKNTSLQPCSKRLQCIMLHNGGILQFDAQQHFGGTASTNAIFFNLDPDGHHGPQGRSSFYQYFDGKLTTGEKKSPGTKTSPTILTSQDTDPEYLRNW